MLKTFITTLFKMSLIKWKNITFDFRIQYECLDFNFTLLKI